MTRPKITPGEWLCASRIVYALNDQPGRNQCNRMTLIVGHGHDDNGKHITNEECEANATAIAAVPDLLAALEELQQHSAARHALKKAGYTF